MKLVLTVVFAAFAAFAVSASRAAPAQDAKPSEASIRQLFELMHSSKLLDAYLTQIDGTVHAAMQQAFAGQPPNAKQQKIMDDLGRNIASLVKEQLNWASVEPMMIEVYRNTFSQPEVDGMLTFYRSEAGQAVISKLPAATQQTMAGIQNQVKALTPKVVQLERDTVAQLRAAGEAEHPAPSPQGAQPPPSPPPPASQHP